MLFSGSLLQPLYRRVPGRLYSVGGSCSGTSTTGYGNYTGIIGHHRNAWNITTPSHHPYGQDITIDVYTLRFPKGRLYFSSFSDKLPRSSEYDHAYIKALEERISKHAAAAVAEYLDQQRASNKNKTRISTAGIVLLVILACGMTVLYVESVRQSVSAATGNAAGGLLYSKTFLDQSLRFLDKLAQDFLNDPATEKLLCKKIEELLIKSQDAINEMVMRVLKDEGVINLAYELSCDVSEMLCKDPEIIQLVGQLLLDAIYTETAVDGAAKWVVALTEREDVSASLENLICNRVFADAKIQLEALNFCKDVTARFLRDQETRRESLAFLKSLLERPSLQAQISQALLGVVKHSIYPRWLMTQEGTTITGLPKQIERSDKPLEHTSAEALRFF